MLEQTLSFGEKLKELRKKTIPTSINNPCLTQEQFGREVGLRLPGKLPIARETVTKWESGDTIIDKDQRQKLIAIIYVLHAHSAINKLTDANMFLSLGNYAQLNPKEALEIDKLWLEESPITSSDFSSKLEIIGIKNEFIDLGLAPTTPDLFLGRDEDMKELKLRLFQKEKHSPTTHVLTAMRGWPGVGKTTLATVLANDPEVKEQFPDGILWTTLGQRPKIMKTLLSWGRACRDSQILRAENYEEASSYLTKFLRNKKCLLIIDDVWQQEDARPFLVAGNNCATIITTRRLDIASSIVTRSHQVYPVNVLEKQYSSELLMELAGSVMIRFPEKCAELLESLEGLPLAIQVAGRMLQTEYISGLDVVKMIDEMISDAVLLESKAPIDQTDLQKETTPTVTAVLMKSLDCLDKETRNCFAKLGAFAEAPAVINIDSMKAIWHTDHPETIIRNLVKHGLLEYSGASDEYKIHGLLKLLCKTLWYNESTAAEIDLV